MNSYILEDLELEKSELKQKIHQLDSTIRLLNKKLPKCINDLIEILGNLPTAEHQERIVEKITDSLNNFLIGKVPELNKEATTELNTQTTTSNEAPFKIGDIVVDKSDRQFKVASMKKLGKGWRTYDEEGNHYRSSELLILEKSPAVEITQQEKTPEAPQDKELEDPWESPTTEIKPPIIEPPVIEPTPQTVIQLKEQVKKQGMIIPWDLKFKNLSEQQESLVKMLETSAAPVKPQESEVSEVLETSKAIEPQESEVSEVLETSKAIEPQESEVSEVLETSEAIEPQESEVSEVLETSEAIEPQESETSEVLETSEAIEPQESEVSEVLETSEAIEPQESEVSETSETPERTELADGLYLGKGIKVGLKSISHKQLITGKMPHINSFSKKEWQEFAEATGIEPFMFQYDTKELLSHRISKHYKEEWEKENPPLTGEQLNFLT